MLTQGWSQWYWHFELILYFIFFLYFLLLPWPSVKNPSQTIELVIAMFYPWHYPTLFTSIISTTICLNTYNNGNPTQLICDKNTVQNLITTYFLFIEIPDMPFFSYHLTFFSFQPQTLQLDFLTKILPSYHHLKKQNKPAAAAAK